MSNIKFQNLRLTLFFLLSFFIALPASADVTLSQTSDYKILEVAAAPQASAFTFDFAGSYIFASPDGSSYRVIKITAAGEKQLLLERTSQPITSLSFNQGTVFVGARGQIYKIARGRLSDVITGLPVYGDYAGSQPIFYNNTMYFITGTATNSGVVGADNNWLNSYPSFHDIPCATVKLSGVNTETDNFLSAAKDDKAVTGSFAPFNVQVSPGQILYGSYKCSGGLIKSRPDGSIAEVYAWGFHNPKGLSVDDEGNFWVLDGAMEDRGVRPVKDSKDTLYKVSQGTWYGWPDFSGGKQIDQPPILAQFPNTPPKPYATFDPGAVKYLMIAPKKFAAASAVAQVSDTKLSLLDLGSKQTADLFDAGAKATIGQFKFGPDGRLYVLVNFADRTSKLYAIETTRQVSAVGLSTGRKLNWIWPVNLSLILLSGIGVYLSRRSGLNPA